MAPLVRRTWAPRGQTPELRPDERHPREGLGRGGVVAVAAAGTAWACTPRRWPTATSTTGTSAAFLEAMLRELPGRFVVVWDGGTMHKGDPIRELEDHFAGRLSLERLPPYAPKLNPVEPLWSWLK